MLIVQGGRDYQVTIGDDLSRWQAALAGRKDVTIRVYDADNHLFFPGSGPSSPEEYEPAQHMDPEVIADIAGWLRGPETGSFPQFLNRIRFRAVLPGSGAGHRRQ